jgi:hypothetical protein
MVVCVVAAAEESTMSRSSRDSTSPTAPLPNTASPIGESTSLTLLEFPRPMPDEPKPANICTDRMTTKYVPSRIRVETTPATPGMR